jgi:hypothetical protein
MSQDPRHNLNLHPEEPPVLEGKEARQGKVYEGRGKRWAMLAGLLTLVAILVALIYFGGGAG